MKKTQRHLTELESGAGVVEAIIGPAVIERALSIYQQLHPRDQSVVLQARKILSQQVFGMIDEGERNEQRLLVGGLVRLKAVERDHDIKSAHEGGAQRKKPDAGGRAKGCS